MNHRREWMEETGSEDSHGRALWALGVGAGRSRNVGHQRLCLHLFDLALPAVVNFTSPRACAFALIGIHEYLHQYPSVETVRAARATLTEKITHLWDSYASDEWPWFEISVTYENARLSQALILSGSSIPDEASLDIGLRSLRWLVSIQKSKAGHYRPIGSNGFYVRNGPRADYDQQPVEAQAMVSACLDAFRVTGDPGWYNEAKRAFEWFLGRNDLGQPVYDSANGGCGDGLHENRVNANQGAESSLAFQISLAEMNRFGNPVSNTY